MTSKYTNKRRLLWVFIALLAYSLQSFACVNTVDNPASANVDKVMGGCHGDHDQPAKLHGDNSHAGCCEDGCSMVGCHSASALVSTINAPLLDVRAVQSQSATTGSVAKLSSSLYRPPILR